MENAVLMFLDKVINELQENNQQFKDNLAWIVDKQEQISLGNPCTKEDEEELKKVLADNKRIVDERIKEIKENLKDSL